MVFGGNGVGSFELANLDGSNGFRLDGAQAGDLSGVSVSSAGDFNGDGLSDLIVGASGADGSLGESYVVFGAQSFSASFDLGSLDGNNGFRLEGIGAGDSTGSSVSGAGDINGDGYDDLIIGAPNGLFGEGQGASYVVFGGQNVASGSLNLGSLDGTNGLRLDGIVAGDQSGSSVASAGDINGDGFDDLIIGAPGTDSSTGASYVVFGGDFTGAVTQLGTTNNDTLDGSSAAAEILIGNLGNDTLISGSADVLRAGEGDDRVEITDLSFFKIDGGGGQDTLAVTGALDLDLTQLSNSAIKSVEAIDLNSTDANTLTLNPEDVFDFSETPNSDFTAATSHNSLMILGDFNDTVELAGLPYPEHPASYGSWTTDGTTTINSTSFDVVDYVANGEVLASLAIEHDINWVIVSAQKGNRPPIQNLTVIALPTKPWSKNAPTLGQ